MPQPFDLLDYLAQVEMPDRLTAIESWHRHIPFAFAVLAMTRPRVFVELGTHRGDSYSAFCQGVAHQRLGTRCFAVDTWQGDSQAGHYDSEIYDDLAAYHDPRYSGFSSLLRMTFDDALVHFVDGSVDLLHIDGLHTYDAVRHDFESWLPKMSERGVVLFHDTNVRRGDFAVWQLWEELTQRYPGFEFPFGFGLGVLLVGATPPAPILGFLEAAQADPHRIIQVFHGMGDAIAYRKAQADLDLNRERVESLGGQLSQARAVVEIRDDQLQALNAARERAELEAQAIETRRQAIEARRQAFERQTIELGHELKAQAQSLEALERRNHGLQQGIVNGVASSRELERRLNWVLGSRLWRTRNRLMRLAGMSHRVVEPVPAVPVQAWPPEARPKIDIIIPVYRGLDDTRRCIESVLAGGYRAEAEVVVINDASPDPQLVAWLNTLEGQVTLLHNPHNLGFVGTVNRGMALHPERDVVLVNSDAMVANDWLDRLQRAAYGAEKVGSVTPFSNNATICSYPRFCQDNALPEGYSLTQLDELFSQVNAGKTLDIPTAIGFCMFIRRDCLSDSGPFDAELFGRGYGEENEFCMRSAERGWRHLLCADTFAYHKGGVSFAETQSEHQRAGHRVLTRLYPDYDRLIQLHIAADPAAHLRFAVDAARTRASGLPVILMINHRRGGGTERHLRSLAEELAGVAEVYVLRPDIEGGKAALGSLDPGKPAQLLFDPGTDFELLLATLRSLGVSRIHFHHTIGVHLQFLLLPEKLDVPYDVTVHDYYLACPQVTLADAQGRYCGAPDEAGCNACLAERPAPGGSDIATWRRFGEQLLYGAERVFTPSQDTLERMRRYFPDAALRCVPHERHLVEAEVQPIALPAERSLRVVVIGALSPFKGADTLEGAALEARRRRLPLEFHLLGFGYRHLRSHPVSNLRVHGAYQEDQLRALLDELQPDLVWFPGSCPETYSYTLSACLEMGLPILASRIGAFPERLAGRPWSWLVEPDREIPEIVEHLLGVREHLMNRQAPEPSPACQAPQAFCYRGDYLPAGPETLEGRPTPAELVPAWARLGHPTVPRDVQPRILRAARRVLSLPLIRPLFNRVPTAWKQGVKRLIVHRA
ncbi:class I SAM-dependent methyltransferase [Pseudomonas sp. RIT-PI-AD]|uniref:class I SAM-dependent methyltransferase n=1 Tax=Pseudomonas sp. RIT-PI-AD TaxID=3035294 RepID=UPI0021DA0236|nr:class I SAM-dependent methyltransferase [Pseudomonas sp. RIT-PI-AD]